AVVHETDYNDFGQVIKQIDNYVDGIPGSSTDDDRTIEYTYAVTSQDPSGHLIKITAKLGGYNYSTLQEVDLVTEYVYGITRGTDNSLLTSNDFVKQVKYPDPTTGQPSTSATNQEFCGYNAQGEKVWKKDQQSTEHVYDFDGRGRLLHDRVTVLGTGLDGAIRRISRTYDALDRPRLVTSHSSPDPLVNSPVNEVKYDYDKFSTLSQIWQEWTGAVNTGTSRKVQYAYSFPTDGTTALRLTSTTNTDGTVVTEVYNSGMDDTLSRVSGRKIGTTWQFQDSYLGLGRLVEREYGGPGTGYKWTLVGTDSANQDNYVGLDLFGRIDDLIVKKSSTNLNELSSFIQPDSIG